MMYFNRGFHPCGTRELGPRVVARSLSALAIAIAIPTAYGQAETKIPFPAARLIIEYNASARDIGVQFFLDAEEWQNVRTALNRAEKLSIKDTFGVNLLNQTDLTKVVVKQ